jgi:glycosyltransferase involved in cell wall biosynthesis
MHPVFDTRIFKKECVSLAKNGFSVSLIAPHNKEEIVDGVSIIPLRSRKSFLDRIYTLPKEAVALLENIKADIYHFHDPELLPFMKNFAAKGHKVIWDAHENYQDTIKSFNSLRIQPLSTIGAKMFNRMELSAAKKYFAGVVTITNKMAEKYTRQGIKTCVLSNYANIGHFNYTGQDTISEKPRLISSGAHFRPRAIIEIAQSYKYIAEKIEAELFFSGKFVDKKLEEEVSNIIKEADPTGKNIVMEGALEYNDLINRAIPKAWVGTVLFDVSDPNNRNGLPNRFFECWANGVPVITTAGTEVAKIVSEKGGGIVIKNNSPQEIANAFLQIAKSKNLRDQLSKQAFENVSKEMNWEANFKDLVGFYKEILSL